MKNTEKKFPISAICDKNIKKFIFNKTRVGFADFPTTIGLR